MLPTEVVTKDRQLEADGDALQRNEREERAHAEGFLLGIDDAVTELIRVLRPLVKDNPEAKRALRHYEGVVKLSRGEAEKALAGEERA